MWKPRRKWVLAGVSLIILLAIVCAFGMQTALAIIAKREARQLPILDSVPAILTNNSISSARGEQLTYRGAQFEVPWNDLVVDKVPAGSHLAVAHFGPGTAMTVSVEPQDGLIQSMKRDKNTIGIPDVISELWGPGASASDYAFEKAVFDTTPQQITPLTPSGKAAGLSVILTIKAILPSTSDSAIFEVNSQNFRGFQLGDPQHHPTLMCLELMSSGMHVELTFRQKPESGSQLITQPNLNRIVHTLAESQVNAYELAAKPL